MARLKLLKVTPLLLAEMCVQGGEVHFRCISGLPENMKVVRSHYDAIGDLFKIVVESPSWEDVPEGALIPAILPMFETIK